MSEIAKYKLNYLLKKKEENYKEQNNEIKKYIKEIFNNIFNAINSIVKVKLESVKENYLDDEFIKKEKRKVKGKKEKKNKKEEKEKQTTEKIIKIEEIININYLQQYIDLLFYMCDMGISFSFRKLVKISNLMLVKDIRIRNYFISKVHTSLIKLKKSHRNLVRLYSIIFLGLSDPNEKIEKNVKDLCQIFLDLLKLKILKYEDYLNNEGYIYIPEVYIFYFIIFVIFNNNLNIYYQSSINNNKNNKYFINIFNSYLKEIKKKFGFVDSTFLLKALNEMKKLECKNIKKIGSINQENTFTNEILKINEEDNNNNNNNINIDFDKVKNGLIDSIMVIIYNNYLSENKRTDKDGNLIYPQIPNILTGGDIQYKDNYIFNINKSKNKNDVQNEEKNKENLNIKYSSSKKKNNIANDKKNKRFSFNEYFKEDNDDIDENENKGNYI